MKFVIWGAGFRGKRLLDLLSAERIVAFIDNDSNKVGKNIEGVPIISFADYCKNYIDYFIIISLWDYDEVEIYLKTHEIYQYFILKDCPTEIQGYGIADIEKMLSITKGHDGETAAVVGSNLFSVLLYEKLKRDCKRAVVCYPSRQHNVRTIAKLRELLDIDVTSSEQDFLNVDEVFLTIRNSNYQSMVGDSTEVINAYDFHHFIEAYHNVEIEKLKGKYKGKRCFIVATGPSLTKADLDVLYKNNEICFSMNRMYNETRSKWKPNFYVVVDNVLITEAAEDILNYKVNTKFVDGSVKSFWEKASENVIKIHAISDDTHAESIPFSEDVERGVYLGVTVTYVCMQIAMYMGFSQLVLLGVDCKYSKDGKNNYFNPDMKDDYKNHQEYRMIECYESAQKYAKEHGIEILNATRRGALDIFDRVEFDSLFEEKREQ